ncbi:hypothetical protein MTsPCn9_18410 [Croceitalea sp. MTPC9]|uniref:hypothetical protein n=1 Tax=unclassified Croceitalea TaxID=2632280 RepID=UPI002B367A86|nr:hypothetical protein MTsPCn6_11260 [Croceitalea sp. MTPC6]GMN16905.1 hypothetical protein MTsPCn9_18410 [Croceitalea sp. MTPC9]
MKKIFLFVITVMVWNISSANHDSVKTGAESIVVIDEFKKIKSSELPSAVVDEILKEYPTSKLRQAYKNNKNTYKLVMVLSSGTARTVYIDSYGRWIQKKK